MSTENKQNYRILEYTVFCSGQGKYWHSCCCSRAEMDTGLGLD